MGYTYIDDLEDLKQLIARLAKDYPPKPPSCTINDLRQLTLEVREWLEAPEVHPDVDSDELQGADRFTIWYDQNYGSWRFKFGGEMRGRDTYVFDLTFHGVIDHDDAVEYLQFDSWDRILQTIAMVHDQCH